MEHDPPREIVTFRPLASQGVCSFRLEMRRTYHSTPLLSRYRPQPQDLGSPFTITAWTDVMQRFWSAWISILFRSLLQHLQRMEVVGRVYGRGGARLHE